MLTTCPECHTCFRVTQAQLDQRRGLVRCGRCRAVFNAYDTLLPELVTPVQPAPPEPPPSAAPAVAMPQPLEGTRAQHSLAEAVPQAPPGAAPEPSVKAEAAAREPEPQAAEDDAAPRQTPDDILLRPLSIAGGQPQPDRHNALWLLASLALVLSLIGQLAYFFRVEIAASWPESRPYLEAACQRLGCTLPLPQDANALRFEASSLESDPEDASRAILRVSLSNRSNHAVAWPHLVLILTDVRDQAIAQRPFPPSEYLRDARLEALGIPAHEEKEIRLDLELKGLAAYGYKLEKRYP